MTAFLTDFQKLSHTFRIDKKEIVLLIQNWILSYLKCTKIFALNQKYLVSMCLQCLHPISIYYYLDSHPDQLYLT